MTNRAVDEDHSADRFTRCDVTNRQFMPVEQCCCFWTIYFTCRSYSSQVANRFNDGSDFSQGVGKVGADLRDVRRSFLSRPDFAMTHESTTSIDSPSPTRGISWAHALFVGCFALVFVYFSYIPLWPTDIWGHVAYGEWILQHGELPTVDPFVDLARGTELIDTAWASQLFFASVVKIAGPEGLSYSFAILSLAIYLVVALLFALRTRRLGLAVLCSGLTWLIAWDRHLVIRPELFGYLFFAGLLVLLTLTEIPGIDRQIADSSGQQTSAVRRWLIRCGMSVLFIAWTNLHGSFAVGLVALGLVLLGAVVERWMQLRDIRKTLLDLEVRESFVLLVIAALSTLANPYGIVLPVHVVGVWGPS